MLNPPFFIECFLTLCDYRAQCLTFIFFPRALHCAAGIFYTVLISSPIVTSGSSTPRNIIFIM